MAKPIRALELHYPMIQFLIIMLTLQVLKRFHGFIFTWIKTENFRKNSRFGVFDARWNDNNNNTLFTYLLFLKKKSKSVQHRHGAGALVVPYIIVIYLQAAPSSLARIRISSFNITQKYQPATHIEQKHCSLHQHDEYRQCSKVFRLETICPQLSPQRFYFLSIPLVTWKMGSWRYFINCLTQRCPYCIIRTIVNSNLFFCLPALSETVVLNLWDTSKEKGGSQWRHFYLPRFRKGFFIHYVASKKTIFKYCLDFKLFG